MDPFVIAGRTFRSRLVVGTGKYPSHSVMQAAHQASGTDMVTVAVRRVDLNARGEGALLSWIDRSKIFLLPNTAACYTAEDAIRTAHLAQEAGLSNWIKLEVIGDQETLFPDNEALLVATRALVKDGFVVLPYTNDDPVVCRKLEDAGAAAVMPLGAPIGSGLGIQNPGNIAIIDVGASKTTLCLVHEGRPVLLRTVLWGGNHLTHALAVRYACNFADAERRKRAIAVQEVDTWLEPVLKELRVSLHAYEGTVHERLTHCWVAGGSSKLRELSGYLAQQLGLLLVGPRQGFG